MQDTVNKAKFSLVAEFLFNVLPLLIIVILSVSDSVCVFSTRDVMYVVIILFGQSLVKFAAGVSNSGKKGNWQYVSFIVSLVIVLGLVPSCVLLASLYPDDTTKGWKLIFIIFETLLSLGSFFVVGLMGQTWLERKDEKSVQVSAETVEN